MTDCIFCRIVAGGAEASVAYEDGATVAFMDMRQVSRGHLLVVPRKHVATILDLDDETGAVLFAAVARVARGVQAAFAPDGINIWQSNGAAAGQEVDHLHVHVMPRHAGDGLLRVYPRRLANTPRAELDAQAEAIRGAIAR